MTTIPKAKAAVAPASEPHVRQLGLHDRVALIQASLVNVPKNGHADVKNADGKLLYKYDYVTEPDMMAALKPLLGAYRVACYISVDEILVDGNMRTVRASMTLACSHLIETPDGPRITDEAYTIRASASGTDKADKAIVKATTSVTRYLLQKGWLIETGGVDPEREAIPHEPGAPPTRASTAQRGGRQGTPPAAAPAAGAAGTITDAQRRKLMATIGELGIPLAAARQVIAVTTGCLSTKQIPKTQFKDVLGDLNGYSQNPAAGDAIIAEWREANPAAAAELDVVLAADTTAGADTPFGPANDTDSEDGAEGGGYDDL